MQYAYHIAYTIPIGVEVYHNDAIITTSDKVLTNEVLSQVKNAVIASSPYNDGQHSIIITSLSFLHEIDNVVETSATALTHENITNNNTGTSVLD